MSPSFARQFMQASLLHLIKRQAWGSNMQFSDLRSKILVAAVLLGIPLISYGIASAQQPQTSLKPEFIMTMRLALAFRPVSDALRVVEIPSGTADGPTIKGKFVGPAADWVRVLPDGLVHLDVRALIETDDQQLIYVAYTGVQKCPKESADKLGKGEMIKADECYLIVAPTFETKSEKYKWLNDVQAIGKRIELQRSGDPHITYEVFAIR
jgi:hypothetical protein